MGYCYEVRNGRHVLCCDVCGFAGGVRKVACKYGYCPATAMCAGCRKSPGIRAEKTAYCEENCREASAEFAAREARTKALLDSGEYVRCSASLAEHDMTAVTFRSAEGTCKVYLMDSDTYRAVPIMEPATVADFEAKGRVIFRAVVT